MACNMHTCPTDLPLQPMDYIMIQWMNIVCMTIIYNFPKVDTSISQCT